MRMEGSIAIDIMEVKSVKELEMGRKERGEQGDRNEGRVGGGRVKELFDYSKRVFCKWIGNVKKRTRK